MAYWLVAWHTDLNRPLKAYFEGVALVRARDPARAEKLGKIVGERAVAREEATSEVFTADVVEVPTARFLERARVLGSVYW